MAEQAKISAIQKYQDLSYRVDELEELIDDKNERITQLENGQEGYVMVEEDLLQQGSCWATRVSVPELLNRLNCSCQVNIFTLASRQG